MPPSPPIQLPQIRVLVVDDDDGYAAALTTVLEATPPVVVVGRGTDGLDGIELARALRPDVLVVDVNMPRLDGFAAARAIRDELADTQIVIVSGEPRPEHAARARAAGADVYLPKDVEFEILGAVVRGDEAASGLPTITLAHAS